MYLRRITLLKENIDDYTVYPFSLPLIQRMDMLEVRSPVTFFVGENGSGKSTLLEAVAYQCGFHTAGGSRHNSYEVQSSEAALGDHVRLSWLPKLTDGFFLRAESFYQFANHIDEMDMNNYKYYGGKSLHQQSHGESFLNLFKHKFMSTRESAIYLLDEPEAALSPARQLSLMRIIHDLTPRCQFIIATHSPILMGYPEADIISFDEDRLQRINYQDTDHYQITRRFLENPKPLLRELFSD
ncbi:AAA family ATPase [Paenibacillus shenyangensis]|uniref:AAA family ATPase n=1 Tax=Paenibacillus sp. A9 TaxID=1284352 RepID=UPI00035F2621|nr:AAA family ATPase [Paenibacillus sp. A9]